jgi:hypothetical protein
MGESGAIGAPAAILATINDAIGHLGVEVRRAPGNPALLRRLISAAEDASRV